MKKVNAHYYQFLCSLLFFYFCAFEYLQNISKISHLLFLNLFREEKFDFFNYRSLHAFVVIFIQYLLYLLFELLNLAI
jgi:hypothetical protein